MMDSICHPKEQTPLQAPSSSATRRPPGPPRGIPGRHLFAFRRDPLCYLQQMASTYGDIVHLPFGRRPVFFFNHPDFIREILVTRHRSFGKGQWSQLGRLVLGDGLLTSEGALHARGRRLLKAAFDRAYLAGYAQSMVNEAARWAEQWPHGSEMDMAQEMARLTLLIAGNAFLGVDLRSDLDAIQQALEDLLSLFDPLLPPLIELAPWLSLPSPRRLHQAQAQLNAVVERTVQSHRQNSACKDLLSLLIAGQAKGECTLDEDAVCSHALTILLAGHETMASALTWTWWLLSQHPRVEARLQAELDAVLDGYLPGPDALPYLRYTRMVLAEALRLYPPIWLIAREAVEDVVIGGYGVPAGATVLVSQWVMHRDPRYYPVPDAFQPVRWKSGGPDVRPQYAYFPFGGGPRACIGAPFAWTEGVLLLATIAQRRRFRMMSDQAVVPDPRVTLRPRGGLAMRVEERARGRRPREG
ncbi:MAG: cytochrome P450 [Chloroflexi bacterium]|nr:cytochrome P450 [Chloroflexota bacterium]